MRKLICLCLLLPALGATGQTDWTPPELCLKWGGTSLIDPYLSSINFMAEYTLSDYWSIQAEVGWILPIKPYEFETTSPSGFRLRPAIRRYSKHPWKQGRFWEFLYVYRSAQLRIAGDFDIEAPDGIWPYSWRVNYGANLQKHGFFINYGKRHISGKRSLVIEYGLGLGLVYHTDRFNGLPEHGTLDSNGGGRWRAQQTPRDDLEPGVMFYLNVGKAFVRNKSN